MPPFFCYFCSGYIADRVNLRYFLSVGIAGKFCLGAGFRWSLILSLLSLSLSLSRKGSGLAALLLGLGYFFQAHHIAYFIVFQIFAGFMQVPACTCCYLTFYSHAFCSLYQSTGWPGLLGVTAKWYGQKK